MVRIGFNANVAASGAWRARPMLAYVGEGLVVRLPLISTATVKSERVSSGPRAWTAAAAMMAGQLSTQVRRLSTSPSMNGLSR